MKNPINLVLILLALGLFFTITSPQWENVKTLQASARDYQNVIQNVERIAETRDRLLVNYEAIPKKEIDRLAKILPDDVNAVELAVDLDTIAARHGISIKNVQIDSSTNANAALIVLPEYDKPYDKIAVSFSFISNYANFTRFLADLEKSLRIMDVKSASFNTEETGLYEHKLTIETYWLK